MSLIASPLVSMLCGEYGRPSLFNFFFFYLCSDGALLAVLRDEVVEIRYAH